MFITICRRLYCSLKLVVRCPLVASGCSSCVVCCSLVCACCLSCDVRGLSLVACCELLVVPWCVLFVHCCFVLLMCLCVVGGSLLIAFMRCRLRVACC